MSLTWRKKDTEKNGKKPRSKTAMLTKNPVNKQATFSQLYFGSKVGGDSIQLIFKK